MSDACGLVLACGRPSGHRGHHGGFRRQVAAEAKVATPPVRGDIRGLALSPREVECLQVYARIGMQKLVALELGMSIQTVKNHFTSIYHKLDVGTSIEAFAALGWLQVPDAP